MNGINLFIVVVTILVVDYIKEVIISYKNAQHFNDPIPGDLEDVYNEEAYQKSQEYKAVNYRFGTISGLFSFIVTLLFFVLEGVKWVDEFAIKYTNNELLQSLIFFGVIGFTSTIIQIPFGYYGTFVIEEKFGFNKSSKKLFFLDKLKGMLLAAMVGGGMLLLDKLL